MRQWDGYRRGVDLGGWFSQCKYSDEHFDTFIGKDDIDKIASWGMDHVRLPIDYNLLETENGEYIPKGFMRVETAISWAHQNGLNIIIDLHKTFGYSFDVGEKQEGFFENEQYQERFYKLWEQIATHFGELHEYVAFELLNEVTDPSVSDTWNRISDTCIRRIRRIAPKTAILVGGFWNNSPSAVKYLNPPQDENIVYNFHCYEPLVFTHQGAEWIAGMPGEFRISFNSTNREYVEAMNKVFTNGPKILPVGMAEDEKVSERFFIDYFKEPVEYAEKYNVPLYCGEYGVIDRAKPEEALAWYSAIHTAFEHYGIGRAAWSYKEMDFGLTDEHLESVFNDLVNLL